MNISVQSIPCVVVQFNSDSHSRIIREPFIQFWISSSSVGLDASVSQFIRLFHKHLDLSVFSALLFLIRDEIPLFSQVKVLYPVKTDVSVGVIDGSGELCPLVFEIFLTLNVEAAIQTTLTTKTSSIISLSELLSGSWILIDEVCDPNGIWKALQAG